MKKIKFTNALKSLVMEYMLVIIIILLMTSALMIFQLKHQVWILGADTYFHSSRIYDTAQQIVHRNFSYFQMNYGGFQSGQIINPVYGPFFVYFLGGLLLLSGTWFKFQIILNYLLFLLGGIGMYSFARKAAASKWSSLLSTLLFLVTGYMGTWIQGFAFNAWGAALMPYVLIQGLSMIQKKTRQVNWLYLGIVMGIVAQVHLLSIFFSVVALIPFFIYGVVISEDRRDLLINVGKSILLFIILTANLWGAFLVLYPSNHIAAPFAMPFYSTALQIGTEAYASKIIIKLTVYVIIFQIIYAIWTRKSNSLNVFLTLIGTGFLLISSQLFPWHFVEKIIPPIATYLQFPNRIAVIGYPLIFAAVAISLTGLRKKSGWKKSIWVMANVLVFAAILVNMKSEIKKNRDQTIQMNTPGIYMTAEKLSKEKDLGDLILKYPNFSPDYLPLKKKVDSTQAFLLFRKEFNPANKTPYHKKVLTGGRLKVNWNSTKSSKTVLLPIVMYSQSSLIVNGKYKDQIKGFNLIRMPYVKSKKGNNSAILSFKMPFWFTIILFVSGLSWIGVILLLIIKRLRSL